MDNQRTKTMTPEMTGKFIEATIFSCELFCFNILAMNFRNKASWVATLKD
jgi:hypothetical protein